MSAAEIPALPSLLVISVTSSDANCQWLSAECEKATAFKNTETKQYVFANCCCLVAKKDAYPGVETRFMTWEAVCEGGFELGTKPVPEATDDIIDFLLARGYSVKLPWSCSSDSDATESDYDAELEEEQEQEDTRAVAHINTVLKQKAFGSLKENVAAPSEQLEEPPVIELVAPAAQEPAPAKTDAWEENLVLCHYAEKGIQRFRIGHAAAPRPLHGAIFTVAGNEYVSINELTLPLDRFLSMKECWSSNTFARFVCDHVKDDSAMYEIQGLTGQQIREAFIFVHEYATKADHDDDATFCAILAVLATLFVVLLTLGYFLRFHGQQG
jgi:hypothetical protein